MFTGFTPDLYAFLAELAAHQDRAWFQQNRARYEDSVRRPFLDLVATLNHALAQRGIPLATPPERSLFRIHRDTRFSRDKRPYKEHAAATISRGGGRLSPGFLYIHLHPAEQYLGAGFYRLEPDRLQRLRAAVVRDPATWLAVEDDLAARGLELTEGDPLKRLPQGWDVAAVAAVAHVLKRRQLIVRRPLQPADPLGPGLVDLVLDFVSDAGPLLAYGWAALKD